MSEPIAPLIAPDVDLTDFGFMPLQIERLRKSKAWLICKRRPELAFYMLNLWMRSWHERPAASIEDDDDVLADAAGCSPERWPEVRDDALRGWVKCSDGRLYHPVVAQLANEKWTDKLLFRWSKECDRIRKENKSRKDKGLEPLAFPARPDQPTFAFPAEGHRNSAGNQKPSAGNPAENALKGEGEGECKGEGDSDSPVTETESGTTSRRPRAKRSPREKTQIDPAWRPSDELRQWTIDLIRDRGSGVSAGHELEKFRDHFKANGKPMKDWDATWRNWIRESIRREGRPNGTHTPGGQKAPARTTAIRTATNFVAALHSLSPGGPDRPGRGTEGDGLESADGFDPAPTARGGE